MIISSKSSIPSLIFLLEICSTTFVSISSNVIKNVYSIKNDFLIELLQHITKEISIKDSIVTKVYSNTYVASGLVIDEFSEYKNFIRIRSDVNG